jgi:hypothetical protein
MSLSPCSGGSFIYPESWSMNATLTETHFKKYRIMVHKCYINRNPFLKIQDHGP